jgi:outer membrane murein-binding lipoprotein Lpp
MSNNKPREEDMQAQATTREERLSNAVQTHNARIAHAMGKLKKIRERKQAAERKLTAIQSRRARAERTHALCDLAAGLIHIWPSMMIQNRDFLRRALVSGLEGAALARREAALRLLGLST